MNQKNYDVEITPLVVEEVFQVLVRSGIQSELMGADRLLVDEMLRKFCQLSGLRVKGGSNETGKTSQAEV